MWDPYSEFETFQLVNGLTVYCSHWPNRQWVEVSVMVHSGARVDKVGLEGTAHFVEHLVSRNQDMTYREIRDHFQNLGGKVELGVTRYNRTHYRFLSPLSSIEFGRSLEIFGNMLLLSDLRKSIEEQRQVIVGEYQKDHSNPIVLENDLRRVKNLYRDSWRERFLSPLGSQESVQQITESDLQNYFDTFYTPSNMSIICTGGLSAKEIEQHLFLSPFSVLKSGERVPALPACKDFPLPFENLYVFEASKHIQMQKKIESAIFETACRVPATFSDSLLGVFEDMLNEILFTEVREKRGWTYDINATLNPYGDFHTLLIHSRGLSLSAVDHINDLITVFIQQLPENKKLFEKIIARKIAEFSMKDISAGQVNSGVMSDLENHGRILTYIEEIELLKKITPDSISSLIQWMEPNRRWTFIAVP